MQPGDLIQVWGAGSFLKWGAGRLLCLLSTVANLMCAWQKLFPFLFSCSPRPERRPGKHQCRSRMKRSFGPDPQNSDVEIEISHSEGPKWLQRSAGGSPVHPPVSRGERCRPELTSADTRASEVLCAEKVCLTSVSHHPPPRPRKHTLNNFKPRGTSHSSGEYISRMQSAFTNRCPRRWGGALSMG